MNEVTGTVLQLDLGLQRLLHPSWDLESVRCMGSEVSSSVFVTLGCHQLNGSCCFARPQSVSVFVFLCLYLHLPPSSSACVFVCLWCHLSLSSFVSVVVPCGCSRGYWLCIQWSTSEGLEAMVVCTLTVCAMFHVVRVKAFVVLSSHN